MGAFLLGLLLLFPSAQDADASGRIVGRVLIRGENIPVAGARVTLLAVRRGPIFNSGPPTPPTQVLSGADGSYAFDRVAPGEYRVTASKTGLATGPGSATPVPVVVAAGQTIEIPDAFLDRAGAIVGRILDPNGEPLVDARVMALRPPPIPPQVLARGYVPPPDRPRPLMPAGSSAQTNDLGEFRIFGLAPGDYVVASIGPVQSPFQSASTEPTTIAMTYFPGVTDAKSAQTVGVGEGGTTSGIEIRLATAAAFLVGGIVVTEDGRPLEGAMVALGSTTPIVGPHPFARADADGRFQFSSVTAGTYRISGVSSSSGPMATLMVQTPVTVAVTDGNVSGVRIVVAPKR